MKHNIISPDYVPPPYQRVQGHIVFGTDPVSIGVSVGIGVKLLVRSVTWIPFGIFWWYLVEMQIRTRWHVTYKIDNSGFLSFWVITLCFIWKKISCLLCNSNTLRNISMVLGRNVEQDETTCHVQEWQCCLSYFCRYLPLLFLTVIIHWFLVCSRSQRPLGIFLWYLVEM